MLLILVLQVVSPSVFSRLYLHLCFLKIKHDMICMSFVFFLLVFFQLSGSVVGRITATNIYPILLLSLYSFFDVQFTWYTTIAHFFSFGLLFSHHLSPLILRLTFEFSALQHTRSFLCWHLSTISKAFSFCHCFHFVLIRMCISAHTAHLFLPCIPCLFYFSMTFLSALIMAF